MLGICHGFIYRDCQAALAPLRQIIDSLASVRKIFSPMLLRYFLNTRWLTPLFAVTAALGLLLEANRIDTRVRDSA